MESTLSIRAAPSQDNSTKDLPTDALVIARVLNGDIEAFAILVDRYTEEFAAYATRMTGSTDDAADIIQESLVRAYRSLSRCRDRSKFKGWLFRIVSNQCKTHIARRRRRRTEPMEARALRLFAPDDPAGDTETAEVRRRLQKALQRLPVDQREALILHYIEGLSVREMADLTSASLSALKMRLLRGRAALREHLEGMG